MANDKERNAIATEIYGSLNNGRLKDKLDWVDSITLYNRRSTGSLKH